MIGEDIIITIVQIRGDKVRLAFDAPKDVIIHREEVYLAIQKENNDASITESSSNPPSVHNFKNIKNQQEEEVERT